MPTSTKMYDQKKFSIHFAIQEDLSILFTKFQLMIFSHFYLSCFCDFHKMLLVSIKTIHGKLHPILKKQSFVWTFTFKIFFGGNLTDTDKMLWQRIITEVNLWLYFIVPNRTAPKELHFWVSLNLCWQ